VVVAASFFVNMIADGVGFSFGVMFDEFERDFDSSKVGFGECHYTRMPNFDAPPAPSRKVTRFFSCGSGSGLGSGTYGF
jgi:hypothetical protein